MVIPFIRESMCDNIEVGASIQDQLDLALCDIIYLF